MEEIFLVIFANVCFLIKNRKTGNRGYFNFATNILFSFLIYSIYVQSDIIIFLYIASFFYLVTLINTLVPNISFLMYLIISDFRVNILLLTYGLLLKKSFCPEIAEKSIILLNMTSKYKSAIALNNKLLKVKRTTKTLNHKLFSLLRIKNYEEADRVVDEILIHNHTNSYYLSIKADIAFHLKKFNIAIEYYEKVLFFKPYSLEITYNLGKAFFELDRYAQSEEMLKKSISINPFFVPALIQLVKLYLKQDLRTQAIKILEDVKGKIPEGNLELDQEVTNLFKKAKQL